jgi:hypothetical protein
MVASAEQFKRMFVIAPYREAGFWMFDDLEVGLLQELLVKGTDTVMSLLAQHLGGVHEMLVYFSDEPVDEGLHAWLVEPELGGANYDIPELGIRAWLCPALFMYFDKVPKQLWFTARRAPGGRKEIPSVLRKIRGHMPRHRERSALYAEAEKERLLRPTPRPSEESWPWPYEVSEESRSGFTW